MPLQPTLATKLRDAQEHLSSEEIDGWLLYDYRGMNPIFADTVGAIANVTRPCWLWVPVSGVPKLLVSYVDQGRFGHLGIETVLWVSRTQMRDRLRELLRGARVVAMEYSPDGALPRVSWVDAGTVEMVRGLGVEVVSSADTVQYATQRWSAADLLSHREAAGRLDTIVQDAFRYIGERLKMRPTEYDVAEFIRSRFREEGMEAPDGPIVAVNEHGADPHFDPTPANSHVIARGDWVLIDLWARMEGAENMYADITWTGYVGDTVPSEHREVFDVVVGARDAAVAAIAEYFEQGRQASGLGDRQGCSRLRGRRGIRGAVQPPAGAQHRARGARQRGQSRQLGDARHAEAHAGHSHVGRAGHLPAGQVRRQVGDRRVHLGGRPGRHDGHSA